MKDGHPEKPYLPREHRERGGSVVCPGVILSPASGVLEGAGSYSNTIARTDERAGGLVGAQLYPPGFLLGKGDGGEEGEK